MKLERKEDESFGNLFNAAEVGWLELIVLKYDEGIKRKTLSRFFNEQRETTASIPSKNYSNVRFYDRVPKRVLKKSIYYRDVFAIIPRDIVNRARSRPV